MFIVLFTCTSNSIYSLSVKVPLQMARCMDIKQDVHHVVYNDPHMKFNLLVCLSNRHFKWQERRLLAHQIQFTVCLSSCQFKWGDDCQSRCSSDYILAHQIQFTVCLSSCQFKWGDDCQTRCSSYCLLHVKFNLWSVSQAANSNSVMNVKQDVHLIVCYMSNSIYGLSVKLPV